MKRWLAVVIVLFLEGTSAFSSQLMMGGLGKNLSLWRYWQNEYGKYHEKFIVLNENDSDVTLQFVIARVVDDGMRVSTVIDSAQRNACKKWLIPAHGYITSAATVAPADNAAGYVYRIYQDSLSSYSLMDISSPKPDSIVLLGIQTTEGINGSGGSSSNRWWEQTSPFIKSGETANVTLVLRARDDGQPFALILEWPDSMLNGRQALTCLNSEYGKLQMDSISSETFRYKEMIGNAPVKGYSYTVPIIANKLDAPQYYPLKLVVQAPIVKQPTMVYLQVMYFYMVGSGGTFGLPFIVVP